MNEEPAFDYSPDHAQMEELRRRLHEAANQHLGTQAPQPPKNRRKVIELARQDPVINGWLHYWRAGEITWEEAMTGIVIVQQEHLKRLLKELGQVARHSPVQFPKGQP